MVTDGTVTLSFSPHFCIGSLAGLPQDPILNVMHDLSNPLDEDQFVLRDDRRLFLRAAGALLVVAATAPARLLGHVLPDRDEVTFTLKLSLYPALKQVGGSVRLIRPERMLRLNPDHREFGAAALEAPRGRYPIAVTRVAATGRDAFAAVSTYCTHGKGYQLKEYDPESGLFVCPHKGACFRADGTHVEREGTPDVRNLRRFPVVFDARRGTLKLTLVA